MGQSVKPGLLPVLLSGDGGNKRPLQYDQEPCSQVPCRCLGSGLVGGYLRKAEAEGWRNGEMEG